MSSGGCRQEREGAQEARAPQEQMRSLEGYWASMTGPASDVSYFRGARGDEGRGDGDRGSRAEDEEGVGSW